MTGDRSSRALARIEEALERLEAAARKTAMASTNSDELADLRLRHTRLREAVTGSLIELDQLIESAQA